MRTAADSAAVSRWAKKAYWQTTDAVVTSAGAPESTIVMLFAPDAPAGGAPLASPETTKLCPDEVTDAGVMVAPGRGLWKNTL